MEFRDDELKKMRTYLKKIKAPLPSEELVERTRMLCHKRMIEIQKAEAASLKRRRQLRTIPAYVWVAFISLVAITVVLMFPLSKILTSGEQLSYPAVMILGLVVQNAVMLFFSPLLLRKNRYKKQSLRPDFNGA